jgi:hypothetical protein
VQPDRLFNGDCATAMASAPQQGRKAAAQTLGERCIKPLHMAMKATAFGRNRTP